MIWQLEFMGGPLADRTLPVPRKGSEPPQAFEYEDGVLSAVADNTRELDDQDRLYILRFQSQQRLVFSWFTGFVCDFCEGKPVRWDYPGRDFITELPASPMGRFESQGEGWAVCEPCHRVIQRTDREALVRRTLDSFKRRGMYGATHSERRRQERETRTLHDDFWANREGAPKPWPGKAAV